MMTRKPVIILLPGTLCDADLFAAQKQSLADLFELKDVSTSSAETLGEIAYNIINEIDGPFSVLGLSYGGILAFELWRQAPERIESLILLNTNHKKPSTKTRESQQRYLGMSQLGEFKEIVVDFLKDAMLHPIHSKNQELRNRILQMALNVGRDNFFRQVKAQLNRPDSSSDLPNIKCPVLVMTGRQDLICTVQIHEEIASLIPNSKLEIIEECGHLSTMEQPQVVNSIIRKWWNNLNKDEK
jgi:pimeloyl-ACP methyl ester carboxylesterase